MKISILVPTRGRPEILRSMWEKCLSTASNPEDVEYIIYIDKDDKKTIKMYKEMIKHKEYGNQIQAIIGRRKEKIAQYHNECYKASKADIVCAMADDCEFQTKGWDKMVLDAFSKSEDKILLVYGSDGHKNKKMAVTWFVHKNWVETIGYINPPFFICGEGDRWVTEVANKIKRLRYLPDMKIIHKFWETKNDSTKSNRAKFKMTMKRLYGNKNLAQLRKNDIRKLKEYIKKCKSNG